MIRLWLFYIFYQSSSATADGQITFLCQKLCCLVQYCFDVLDSIFGAKKEIQIMCDQLRFVRHFHEMRHLVFFFVEDNNQMCNIRKRNSTLSDLGHQLYFCWRTILPPYVAQIILDNWLPLYKMVDKAYDKKHNVFNRIYWSEYNDLQI